MFPAEMRIQLCAAFMTAMKVMLSIGLGFGVLAMVIGLIEARRG